MLTFLRKLRSDERGISALEYALLAGTILVVIGGVMSSTNISSNLTTIFTNVSSELGKAATKGTSTDGTGG